MAALITRRKRTRQPQQFAQIDWGNSLAQGLVHAWGLNTYGDTKAYDATGRAHGTFGAGTGGTFGDKWILGPNGYYINFDNTGTGITFSPDLAVGDSSGSGSPGSSKFSFLARCRLVSGSISALYGCASATGGGIYIRVDNSTGKVQLLAQGQAVLGSSTTSVTYGVDIDIAVTFDGTNGAFYINGSPAGTFTNARTFTLNVQYYLGAGSEHVPNGTRLYKADVYNRALGAGEVKLWSANPWQFFKPPSRRLLVAPAADGLFSASGSSVGVSSLTAVALAVFNAYPSSTGSSATSAGSVSLFQSSASSACSSTAAGASISVAYGTGSAQASSTVSGTGVTVTVSNGSSTSTATVSGNAYSVWSVQANTAGSAGNIAGGLALFSASGAAVGTSVVSGTGVGLTPADGTASGTAIGTSSATAVVSAFYNAVANAIGSATVSGSGGSISSTSANASGTSLITGTSISRVSTVANSSGASSASGDGVILACASGTATGLATVNGLTIAIYGASGVSVSAAQVQAIAAYVAAAIGSSGGKATVSGVTGGGLHYTASGDKFAITLILSPYKLTLNDMALKLNLN